MKLTGFYTAAGASLAASALAAGAALTITKAAAGGGVTQSSDTAFSQQKQLLSILRQSSENGVCTVTAYLSALNADQSYPLREVALFARSGTGAETLYKVFRLDEPLTISPEIDLGITFYLTEAVAEGQQLTVTISQEGMMTAEACSALISDASGGLQTLLNGHKADNSAHAGLFAGKAALSHTHGAGSVTAGTLGGQVAAYANENYTAAQLRNVIQSTADPTGGGNGDLWIKYSA